MTKLIRNEGYWRVRAEEALAISTETRNPECKRIMREQADTYDFSLGLPPSSSRWRERRNFDALKEFKLRNSPGLQKSK